jgi:hypothetical protein
LPTASCNITLRHWTVGSRRYEGTWCNIQVSGAPTAVKESHSIVTSTVDERPASVFGRSVPRYALYRKAGCRVGLDAVFAVSRRPQTSAAVVRSQASPFGICGGHSGTGTGFSLSIPFHQFSTYSRRFMLSVTTHFKTVVPAWGRHQIPSSRNQSPFSFVCISQGRAECDAMSA